MLFLPISVMMVIRFLLNEKDIESELPPGMVLLDFIRYQQRLTGTKIGCREGDCGACTVLVGEIVNGELRYRSATSCLMPLGNVNGKHIVTIEGINMNDLNLVQQAMSDEGATQCGFCTPGFVMSLAGFCLSERPATYENAIAAIDGNICRCTGYKSIERAAAKVALKVAEKGEQDPVEYVAENGILPEYFKNIKKRLTALHSLINDEAYLVLHGKKIVGGGTDLYVQQHVALTHAEINFISDRKEMNGIVKENNRCIIGAAATVTDLCESSIFNDAFPQFSHYAKLVSSTPIRNMATLAGNFVNASPIGDLTIFFLALDAILVLTDGKSKRELPLRKFYNGYKQLAKTNEEYIEKFYFPLPGVHTLFNFEKVSKRTHLDIASVNTAIQLEMEGMIISNASVSAGGIGPVPMFLKKTSAFLKNKTISEKTIEAAFQVAQEEIKPISDARGTEAYKRLLLRQLMKAHFMKLFPDEKSY